MTGFLPHAPPPQPRACHLPLPPHPPHPLPYPYAHPHARAAHPEPVEGRERRADAPRRSTTPHAEGAGLALPRCGCRACPALFPFVDFAPFSTEAVGARSARAWQIRLVPLCRHFRRPHPGRRRPVRVVPGRYDLSPFVDLSVAPQTQSAPRFSRHGPPEKARSTIQCNSIPWAKPGASRPSMPRVRPRPSLRPAAFAGLNAAFAVTIIAPNRRTGVW